MFRTKKYLHFILLALALTGCSTASHIRTADSPKAVTTIGDPDAIQVYSVHSFGKTYQTLGLVVSDADAGSDAKTAVADLKEEAAKLGANAIVDLSLEINQGFWENAIRATGIAVRY
jgi:uncharacterized protein YbjQ (UPF0145 family)